MSGPDLLDDIAPLRRWTDHHQERRIADRLEVARIASVEYRNNGASYVKAYKHVCAGCGREFVSNRRQLPGKRSWCGRPECRKVAATERARAYRERRAQTNA